MRNFDLEPLNNFMTNGRVLALYGFTQAVVAFGLPSRPLILFFLPTIILIIFAIYYLVVGMLKTFLQDPGEVVEDEQGTEALSPEQAAMHAAMAAASEHIAAETERGLVELHNAVDSATLNPRNPIDIFTLSYIRVGSVEECGKKFRDAVRQALIEDANNGRFPR